MFPACVFSQVPESDESLCSILTFHQYFRILYQITLREEHRLRVFENRVLRRIFGPKRDEVTGEWTNLYNEELVVCTLLQL
jgi:hypothetical protein